MVAPRHASVGDIRFGLIPILQLDVYKRQEANGAVIVVTNNGEMVDLEAGEIELKDLESDARFKAFEKKGNGIYAIKGEGTVPLGTYEVLFPDEMCIRDSICPITAIDLVITDRNLNAELAAEFESANVNLVLA